MRSGLKGTLKWGGMLVVPALGWLAPVPAWADAHGAGDRLNWAIARSDERGGGGADSAAKRDAVAVEFDTGSVVLTDDEKAELDQLAAWCKLDTHRRVTIRLPDDGLASLRRGIAIKGYLVFQRVNDEQVKAVPVDRNSRAPDEYSEDLRVVTVAERAAPQDLPAASRDRVAASTGNPAAPAQPTPAPKHPAGAPTIGDTLTRAPSAGPESDAIAPGRPSVGPPLAGAPLGGVATGASAR